MSCWDREITMHELPVFRLKSEYLLKASFSMRNSRKRKICHAYMPWNTYQEKIQALDIMMRQDKEKRLFFAELVADNGAVLSDVLNISDYIRALDARYDMLCYFDRSAAGAFSHYARHVIAGVDGCAAKYEGRV